MVTIWLALMLASGFAVALALAADCVLLAEDPLAADCEPAGEPQAAVPAMSAAAMRVAASAWRTCCMVVGSFRERAPCGCGSADTT
ncbi:MAG TPA: hypothetical protein VF482_18145 [Trebonia sp.]